MKEKEKFGEGMEQGKKDIFPTAGRIWNLRPPETRAAGRIWDLRPLETRAAGRA